MDKRKNSGKKLGDKSDLLSKEEMDKLLSIVIGDLYFTTLYTLLKCSGRRIGEVYGNYKNKQWIGGIRLKDINFKDKRIKTIILKTKKQKTKRVCAKCSQVETNYKTNFCRQCGNQLEKIDISNVKKIEPIEKEMPLREEIINTLSLFINNHNPKFKDDDYIFREKSLIQLKKKIKQHLKQANIQKKFSLHGFRHYFISNLIKGGLTENQIIKWTGHTNTSSLTSYNQLVPDDIKDKVNNIIL